MYVVVETSGSVRQSGSLEFETHDLRLENVWNINKSHLKS